MRPLAAMLGPWLARALAGCLLIGGWLVLGALGRDFAGRGAGGAAVIALWLVSMALGRRWVAGRAYSGGALRWSVVATGLATAALLNHVPQGGAGVLAALAVAWGLLLAALSRRVPGLFDCAVPMPLLASWREPAEWPLLAARLCMLPMMLMLPQMAEWCGGSPEAPSRALAWHLAAMLLPALAGRRLLRRSPRAVPRAMVALLLGAGLAVLVMAPGVAGLMSASLLHAAAWSLAWAAGPRHAAAEGTSGWGFAVGPVAALLLGVAVAADGPIALIAVHAVLATVGLAGMGLAGVFALAGSVRSAPADPAARSGSPRRPPAGNVDAAGHPPHSALAPARLRSGPP